MPSTHIVTPLRYIEGGQDARLRGEFLVVSDPDSLYMAFVSFCEFMREEVYTEEAYNKRGEDVSTTVSVPLQLENFWLYAHLERSQWDKLYADPETAGMCTLIQDAFNAQQIEGAILGFYGAKMVQILQQRADKIELSGSVAVEQITGMTVI